MATNHTERERVFKKFSIMFFPLVLQSQIQRLSSWAWVMGQASGEPCLIMFFISISIHTMHGPEVAFGSWNVLFPGKLYF